MIKYELLGFTVFMNQQSRPLVDPVDTTFPEIFTLPDFLGQAKQWRQALGFILD